MNWMKAFSAGSMALAWFTKASADGKITAPEVVELVESMLRVFGLRIDLPDELIALKAPEDGGA